MSDRTSRQSNSRAEQLRQKRQQIPSRVPVMPVKQEVPNPVRQPATNAFGKTAVPPVQQPFRHANVVTTRNYPYSTPLRETVATEPRPKIYRVANGVETRFPALPRIRFSWQWVSGLLTVVFITLILLMVYLPEFEVKNIQVEGLQRVQLADVQTVIENATGSIFTLDIQQVLRAVALTYPELTNINLAVDTSGALKMTVVERQPVLAWMVGDTTVWVDAEGVIMTPRGEVGPLLMVKSDFAAPLVKPIIHISSPLDYANRVLHLIENPLTPEDVINYIDPTVLKAAIDLNSQLPSGAILVYDSISGMGWQDPRGWKVYFGLSLENIQFKQTEYQAIVDRLTELGIKPHTISVEHIDSPYYRTE